MTIIESMNPTQTFEFGFNMGANATAGDVICLLGDLGVGKTVFTQGFAKGLDIKEHINSPTFTIIQEYHEGRIPLYHFDVYRISDVSEMDEIGYEEYFFGDGVSLVEWGDIVKELLPDNTKVVTIEKDATKGFDYRRITLEDNVENL